MIATVLTVGLHGLKPYLVRVTATKANRQGSCVITGLTECVRRETWVRVSSALRQVGVESADWMGVDVTIEPAPSGPVGLTIAVSILVLLGKCGQTDALYIGELDMHGNVRPTRGVLPMLGVEERLAIVPKDNGPEAAWSDHAVWTIDHLRDMLPQGAMGVATRKERPSANAQLVWREGTDIADVPCPSTRRVLEIAAAGRHGLLLVGPRGSGSMLAAKALTGILSPMTHEESLTVTSIHSVSGLLQGGLMTQRPFRAPHHTVSAVAMVGGGNPVRPGEASLAHHGVLYLGDMQDCRASVLEALNDVLRSGSFGIVRHGERREFPTAPLLVGHVWPCPCGERVCQCKPERIKAYRERLQSLPIWRRFDMRVRLREPSSRGTESSADVQARTVAAQNHPRLVWREDAQVAYAGVPFMLDKVADAHVTRLSQTIAAMSGALDVGASHVTEAISYAASWPE